MKSMKSYLSLFAGLGLSAVLTLGASTAMATSISVFDNTYSLDESFIVSWSETVQIEEVEDGFPESWVGEDLTLSGSMTFTITLLNENEVQFRIGVVHATDTSDYDNAEVRFTAFGFNTAPSLSDANIIVRGIYFDEVTLTENLPGVTVDLCAYTGQNCSAADGGVPNNNGSTDQFTLSLEGDLQDGLALSGFGVRHAGDLGSYTFAANGGGTPGNGGGTPGGNGNEIPEPATLALFGGGLLGLGWMMRRRNRVDHIG